MLFETLLLTVLGLCFLASMSISHQLSNINTKLKMRVHDMGGVEMKLERIRAEIAKTARGGGLPAYINHE